LQSTEKDLKGVDGSVSMQVAKTYEAVQPLQTNSLAHKEELPSGVAAIVADIKAELPPCGWTLLPKVNDEEQPWWALCLIDGWAYWNTQLHGDFILSRIWIYMDMLSHIWICFVDIKYLVV
jgi:hypothetical protein